jgi:hypothetical protein
VLTESFFDPLWISEKDKKLYAPVRFRDIVKERYLISKNTHTSYNDTKDITPTEREILLQLIVEDLQRQQELIEKQKREAAMRNKR